MQMVRTSELKFGTQLYFVCSEVCQLVSFKFRTQARVKLSLLVDPLMANPINRGVDQRQKVSFEAFLTINIVIEIHYSLNEDHIIFTPCVIYLRAKHDYTCSYLRFRVLISGIRAGDCVQAESSLSFESRSFNSLFHSFFSDLFRNCFVLAL